MSNTLMSLWVGDLDCAKQLSAHLKVLYGAIGHSHFKRDPRVCAEMERVPVEELLEPFSLPDEFAREAMEAAAQKSLRLASVVVVVYTQGQLRPEALQPSGCGLRYLGTFPVA